MRQFDAAPPIPIDYPRLRSLATEEVELAISASYVAETSDPRKPVRRQGLDNYDWPYLGDYIRDWRIRTYIIWFCYLYESLHLLKKPLTSIEELLMEFKAPEILDLPGRRLATLYTGVSAADPLSADQIDDQRKKLKSHYDKSLSILEKWKKHSE
jgi:hypothetical protein